MKSAKLFGALAGITAGITLLAGCGTFGQSDVNALNGAQPTGSPFTQALTRQYRDLTNYEWDRMADWRDGQYFAQKGLRAAQGTVVPPDEVQSRTISPDMQGELAQGRARLVAAFDRGARERAPEQAALAQARYDCWLEQQEEGWQTTDISVCRQGFNEAMAALEGTPAPVAAPPADNVFLVFFDFDRSEITQAGQRVINDAIAAARRMGSATVAVVGHTDTSGSAQYNEGLSRRRANAVREALLRGGINAGNIVTEARGETQPMVATGDGVHEPSNRRAEIRFRM